MCKCGHTWEEHYYAEDDVLAPCKHCKCRAFIPLAEQRARPDHAVCVRRVCARAARDVFSQAHISASRGLQRKEPDVLGHGTLG